MTQYAVLNSIQNSPFLLLLFQPIHVFLALLNIINCIQWLVTEVWYDGKSVRASKSKRLEFFALVITLIPTVWLAVQIECDDLHTRVRNILDFKPPIQINKFI